MGSLDCVHNTEEFYEVEDFPLDMAGLNRALRAWERTYNTIRPHQALDGKIPAEYLEKCHPELALKLSHM